MVEEDKKPAEASPPDPTTAVTVTVPRFWLFAGPILDDDATEQEIQRAGEKCAGFEACHVHDQDLGKLLRYARETWDAEYVWWHVVDMLYKQILVRSHEDVKIH